MQEFITIENDPQLEGSQDFAFLKNVGLKHIEALSSQLWTDYNEHDPGITIMEVLAYAITDLGYRTGYDVKDLITPGVDAQSNHEETFHKAASILPCNPVTDIDLREVLIDIRGVRNAWIKVATSFENEYFVDYEESVLSTDDPGSDTQEKVERLNGLYHVVIEFDRLEIPLDAADRNAREMRVLGRAKRRLMRLRNFCEDYFTGVKSGGLASAPRTKVVTTSNGFENIVMWADIEVEPNSDMEKVHAQIYFDVEQFLTPYVTFYSLQERLAQGKTIDEIFEGPILPHGFIDAESLEKIQHIDRIHTSDLYQVVMDVPGVLSVKSIQIANYLSSNGIEPLPEPEIEVGGEFNLKELLKNRGQEWCLELNSDASTCDFYELILETVTKDQTDKINKTIKFYTGENSVPVSLNTTKTYDELQLLRQNDRKRRERLGEISFDLEVPTGQNRELEDYYPVQNELPMVYGTGLSGLADEVSDERKGQAAQLKAYLLFFEQLLTNYLAQLNNVRHLFSWDDSIDKTYYTQVLENIKNRDHLYVEEYDSLELVNSGTGLDETRMSELLQEDTESPDVYFDRRSRFLNHLIARFNEKFVEYSVIMHSIGKKDRLIGDKAKFLEDYDLISRDRGRGFNYAAMRDIPIDFPDEYAEEPDVWDTSNVTGYQHRLSRFLGLCDERRRFLYSGHDVRFESRDARASAADPALIQYRYVLTINPETKSEVIGEWLSSDEDAFFQFEDLIESQGKDNVTVIEPLSPFTFELQNSDTSAVIATSVEYPTAADRTNALVEINDYFDEISAFITDIFESSPGEWTFRIKITSASPEFYIEGFNDAAPNNRYASSADAQAALDYFMSELKLDELGFALPALGVITNNEFFFQIVDSGGVEIGRSEQLAFVDSEAAANEGMMITEEFLNEYIGYKNAEGGLHVVEHILLRPKTDNMSLFDVDVKEYDAIDTAENPPVAYPVDYDGLFESFSDYSEPYYLCSEVELTDPSENPTGNLVLPIEVYISTLSSAIESEYVVSGTLTWDDFLTVLRDGDPTKFKLKTVLDSPIDQSIWQQLLDGGYGCDFSNYVFGTVTIGDTIYHYYFILEIDAGTGHETILGGLVMKNSSFASAETVKERALRANAYFCDNTTCKGIANPYEFRATVIIPAWTERAQDYNYRNYSEKMARLEAPAHVAMDIKWVNRSQMRDFEICYKKWLVAQGEYLALDRSIARGLATEVVEAPIVDESDKPLTDLTASTNLSNALINMTNASLCLFEKLAELEDVFQSSYKSVARNDQYFSDAASEGTKLAWVLDAADGSVINRAEIVGGILPPYLGFFDGEDFIGGTPSGGQTYNAGDFMVIDPTLVVAEERTFSVKTYSDTGQVSCTTVTIKIIRDIEAYYTGTEKCYPHFEGGTIVADVQDDNGVISTAQLISPPSLPVGLRLLLNSSDASTWATSNGHPPALYQAGDIVVDGAAGTFPITHPINDHGGPYGSATGNVVVNAKVLITDITGGQTMFTAGIDPLNDGNIVQTPDFAPIKVYGNLGVSWTKSDERYLGSHDTTNTVFIATGGVPNTVLMTFTNNHHNEGIKIVDDPVLTAPTGCGLAARANPDGKAEISVDDYSLFNSYVSGLTPSGTFAEILITSIIITDECGFENTWSGNLLVIPDREPILSPITTECSGVSSGSILLVISDSDRGIYDYAVSSDVAAKLGTSGVVIEKDEPNSPYELRFKVLNPTAFLTAVANQPFFDNQTTVNGVQVKSYTFPIEITDRCGTIKTIDVSLSGPVNLPFECNFAHPVGTSQLAYVNSYIEWTPFFGSPIVKYSELAQVLPAQGNVVVSFTDPNDIVSISCSCLNCDGSLILPTIDFDYSDANVVDVKVDFDEASGTYFPSEDLFAMHAGVKDGPISALGSKSNKKKSSPAELKFKVSETENGSKEKFIIRHTDTNYEYKIPFYNGPVDPCPCLTNWGLQLDKNTNQIIVSDVTLFMANAKGTKKFSITVTDGCGVTSCKLVTLNFSEDTPAEYIDVKNNSYLNALNVGDIIGYPEDVDGQIVDVELVTHVPEFAPGYFKGVDHTTILPPGTAFNTNTGQIKVIASGNTGGNGGVIYVDGISNAKKTQTAATFNNEGITAKTQESGNIMFFAEKKAVSENGTDGAQGGLVPLAIANGGMASMQADMSLPGPKEIVSNTTSWLSNPGPLKSGSWPIHVITTDVHGGVTAIEYTIVIRKNKIINGVSTNQGFTGGFKTLKSSLKTNYSKILKVDTTTKAVINLPDSPLIPPEGSLPENGLKNFDNK